MKTNVKNEFKQTEIGEIPADWEVVRLGDVCKILSGGPAPQEDVYFGGKNYFVRVQHIDNNNSVKGYDLITDDAVYKNKLKLFPKGTIIFPKTGATIYLEKRAKLPFDAYIVSHLCALNSISDKLFQEFLYFIMLRTKLSKNKEDTYPTLKISEISNLLIPIPPLEEQKKIAEILSKIDKMKEEAERKLDYLNEFFNSALDLLITGKVRLK